MPEATVDEDDQLEASPHDVATRPQAVLQLDVDAESDPASMQLAPDQHLRLGVSALLPGHAGPHRCGRGHRPIRLGSRCGGQVINISPRTVGSTSRRSGRQLRLSAHGREPQENPVRRPRQHTRRLPIRDRPAGPGRENRIRGQLRRGAGNLRNHDSPPRGDRGVRRALHAVRRVHPVHRTLAQSICLVGQAVVVQKYFGVEKGTPLTSGSSCRTTRT